MNAQITSRFNEIKPYFSAGIAIMAVVSLTAANYFMLELASHAVDILWVILVAAIFVLVAQITHSEKSVAKHLALFTANKERLASEIKYRLWAEKTSSENKARLQIIDENFPVMLAYFNTEQQCRYHNRAYRLWFGLNAEQIDNQFLREFLTADYQHDIKKNINDVLAGELVQNQRTQKLPNGLTCLIIEQFIPHFDPKGNVIGFYTLYTPRVLKENEHLADINQEYTKSDPTRIHNDDESDKGSEYNPSPSSPIGIAAQIIRAIEQDKFHLYCQSIISTQTDPNPCMNYEILIRMAEEEKNLIPPGAFLSFAEEYNLMPRLDRWVVSYMTKWLSTHQTYSNITFCINLAKDTLADPQFIDFVIKQIEESNIAAQALCFEIEESDAKLNLTDTAIFSKRIREIGCRISLSSFSHDRTSFNLLKAIKVDFIKIDGNLIDNILHDPDDLTKICEINRIAHLMKIQTIAEFVESLEIIEKLREIDVDFAQGYGISQPFSLKEFG